MPLDRWSSVSGGWDIPIVYALQSPSQLYERWGRVPGQAIWNNTTGRLVVGGLANCEYLDEVSKPCGERDEPTVTVSQRHLSDVRQLRQ